MAKDTQIALRNALIYQVYIRNHTQEGTFRALEGDLPRIRALGAQIIHLLPIHPIGEAGKKGSLGCPYANRDYRGVNPAYGTMADFRHLVDAMHAQGLKCVIDVVYNHTSPDSTLSVEHPEYFYHTPDGAFGNRIGDWADVIDLDYGAPGLWDYQIETLKMWAEIVDGFRCDVATLVPIEFWMRARAACESVKPGLIWLAETVHERFNRAARREGLIAFSDAEGYGAFDIEYDYDIREKLDDYWAGVRPLHEWVDALNAQECAYPANFIKLRCLENHDQPRIAGRVSDPLALKNWHALLFFEKGAPLVYAGEEFCDRNQPSLFDRDPVNWDGADISAEIAHLAEIKREHFPADGWFSAEADDAQHGVCARFGGEGRELLGLFSLRGAPLRMRADVPDGRYLELISGEWRELRGGAVETDGRPLILKLK